VLDDADLQPETVLPVIASFGFWRHENNPNYGKIDGSSGVDGLICGENVAAQINDLITVRATRSSGEA
jgi:hypothetical protein